MDPTPNLPVPIVVEADNLSSHLADMAYPWPLRRYQQLAVDAFERGRSATERAVYLVLPPGAGKTVLGLEIARRLGRRTLVLCPNTAVQAQWLRQWQDFQPPLVPASAEAGDATPLTVLTYQAMCDLDSDDAALVDHATALWRESLEVDEHLTLEQAEIAIQNLAAVGNAHYRDELAHFRRKARVLVAEGGSHDELLGLLHVNARALIDRMKAAGAWTLVLDECHHLLEMWGYLTRALIQELGDAVVVVGLTATPPGDMDPREQALYRELFAQTNFEVATPAVVREGDLAPYQELAYLTLPLEHESRYIAEQHARFQALLDHLMEPDFGSVPFLEWLRERVRVRQSKHGAQVSWTQFERDEPSLALAALRFFYEYKMDPPEGVNLGERHRLPPTADDWVALIGDYCTGHLKRSVDPRDEAAWQEIRSALPSLGYVLTRQGIRAYVSPVDRVLSLSASKATAALEILTAERQVLGPSLRALILCDYEHAGSDVLARLRGVLDPQAGSAALLLRILVADSLVATLDPILVTGRTVACSRSTAVSLGSWIEAHVPELRGTLSTDHLVQPGDAESGSWDDLVVLKPAHSWWQPSHYVPLITRYFEEGNAGCLVGTRGLLGEGWDAKRVNVLIDLTAASTSTAVHQMRGRSLRLDPALPRKVANNWDVVCVAREHPKGMADYARFVRKHRQYYAPTLDGEIESGVSHVHPALSPFGPPASDQFASINDSLLDRAQHRDDAYSRWQIGTPYENAEISTVRIRFQHSIGLPHQRVLRYAARSKTALSVRSRTYGVAATTVGVGLVGAVEGFPIVGALGAVVTATVGISWIGRSLVESVRRLGPSDTLEDLAAAVADGLRATHGIDARLGADSVRLTVQADGYYRCYLDGASVEESRLFSESLDELLAPLALPRYIIPRYIADIPASGPEAGLFLLRRAMTRRPSSRVVYHAVPAYLAANRERVQAFQGAWNRFVSPGEALYSQDPRAQGIIEVQRGDDPFKVTTQMRTLWR